MKNIKFVLTLFAAAGFAYLQADSDKTVGEKTGEVNG